MYKYRYVARVLIEATTPLRTASGKSDIFIDSPVLKDWNGLPMILGSSIAGVLRHSFDEQIAETIFGFEREGKDEGEGSRIIISHAHLCDAEGKVHQGLGLPEGDALLPHYSSLPVREHVAIDHKGTVDGRGKFDEEVVFRGSRFMFELEFLSNQPQSDEEWKGILQRLSDPLLRLGAGGTKGFGQFKIVACYERCYEMGRDYYDKPSDMNELIAEQSTDHSSHHTPTKYVINLQPDDFFIFGAGFGDDEVDDVAVTEKIVEWDDADKGSFSNLQILFPASSLKGALSHRVAFHYNRLKSVWADDEKTDIEEHTGTNNHAVATLFGAPKGHANEGKGKALFSDMYKPYDETQTKIFDHVRIDRFTGGAMDGALFNEQTIASRDTWRVEILLSDEIDSKVKEAFEATLDDLAKGWLPLGGKVNRGHGVFISPDYTPDDPSKRGWERKGEEHADRNRE